MSSFRYIFILILLQMFCQKSIAWELYDDWIYEESLHEDWIKKDSIIIRQIVGIVKNNPGLIYKYVMPDKKYQENLGFGYSLIQGTCGGGYAGIFYSLVYRYQKLVSYELRPQMPHDSRLTKRYLNIYRNGYKIKQKEPQPIYYNFDLVSRPIGLPFSNIKTSKEFNFLMTPFSDCVYGDFGMTTRKILENRRLFNELKDQLTADKLNLLLHSINPATRMIAAEYFYKNPNKFPQWNRFNKVITDNLRNLPTIQTFQGCNLTRVASKLLLIEMIKKTRANIS